MCTQVFEYAEGYLYSGEGVGGTMIYLANAFGVEAMISVRAGGRRGSSAGRRPSKSWNSRTRVY